MTGSGQWPIGTIARIRTRASGEVTALRSIDGWHSTERDSAKAWIHSVEHVTVLRPLVVLDFPDPDAAVRALSPSGDAQSHLAVCEHVAREIKEQTKPRPPEPAGLGAVVEDAEGSRWVRSDRGVPGHREPWTSPGLSGRRMYAEIPAPIRVLSEGVS